ncbi:MAG: alpha-glucan family phosphorylase [Nitrospinota bacterium]
MPEFRKFVVNPSLPEKLAPLEEIAYNLWWTWNPDAVNLLRRIDRDLWEKFYHNPVKVLGSISQERIRELEKDDGFLTHIERVIYDMVDYMRAETWFDDICLEGWNTQYHIAYLSLEFGIDECLPIYSGGLGILAGDHLKSASDLGVPIAAVGMAYTHGYFMQYLNQDGWQQEVYPDNDFYLIPLRLEKKDDGSPFMVEVPFPDRTVYAQVWRAKVGRVPLYLLDTKVSENSPEDQLITSQLYGGDLEMRIKQEILLGVGGVRVLDALGIKTAVYHMNEGHSAFSGIERIIKLMKKRNFAFIEAKEAIISSSVFTTHTPVPAGNDTFEQPLAKKYLSPLIQDTGIDMDVLLALGRQDPEDEGEPFCMTVLALRLSAVCNGVSMLHGDVSRKMWKNIWPDVPLNLLPIRSITNGIHIRSWISEEMRQLFDRYLGQAWINKPGDDDIWKRIKNIPDAELWRTHERRRERLVGFVRKRLAEQLRRRGVSESEIKTADEVLDPEALTIGFARRFATYKRGTLIFKDLARLEKMLNDKDRPVQIIFAGKSHPKDNEGKNFIKDIIHVASDEKFRRRIVFVENYDIDVARYLVQGCDVWLNNPRRPMEASGTSGMKASANGGLNLSVLDGWWVEGYSPETGWAIGAGEDYEDQDFQDSVEGRALYNVLEKDVVPLFYDRGNDRVPRNWLAKMKTSMMKLNPVFNTNRMVREYAEKFYLPLGLGWQKSVEKDPEIMKNLAGWKQKMKKEWKSLRILEVKEDDGISHKVGDQKEVEVLLELGNIEPKDIIVEFYYGYMDGSHDLTDGKAATLKCEENIKGGMYKYKGNIPCENAGLHGYAIRILPYHKHLVRQYIPGLILWG